MQWAWDSGIGHCANKYGNILIQAGEQRHHVKQKWKSLTLPTRERWLVKTMEHTMEHVKNIYSSFYLETLYRHWHETKTNLKNWTIYGFEDWGMGNT